MLGLSPLSSAAISALLATASAAGTISVDEEYWQAPNRYATVCYAQSVAAQPDELATASVAVGATGVVTVVVRQPVRAPHVFTDTDELAFTSSTVVDEDFWTGQRFESVTYRQPWFRHDEDQAGLLGGFRLDEESYVPTPYTRTEFRQPLVYTDTEESATSIASIALDDDTWTPTSYAQPSVRQPVLGTDEDHAGVLGGLRVDECYWTPNPYVGPTFRQPVTDADDDHAGKLGGLRVDEDQWIPNRCELPSFRQPVLDTDDDHASPLGGLRLDEEGWDRQVSASVTYRQPVFDDETNPPVSIATIVDEPDAALPSISPARWNAQRGLEWDDEPGAPLGGLRVEDDGWICGTTAPVLYRQPWIVDEDDRVSPPAPFGLDDDAPLPRLAVGQPWPRPRTYVGHEELSPRGLDEQEWTWPNRFQAVQYRQLPHDTDEFTVITHTFGSQGEQVVALIKKPIPRPLPFLDQDELGFTAPAFGLDDDLWIQPGPQRLPSSSLVVQGTEEDHAGLLGGLRVDEEYFVHGRFQLDPFRQPLSDTDENWFPAATLGVDEEFWARPYQQPLWTSTFCVQEPDENHAASLGGFRLDDDLWVDLRSRPATLFLQPSFVPDEWFIPVDEEIVHRVWQPQWTWVTRAVETFQDELGVQPFGRDEEYWVAPRQLQWPTLRRPVWAEDDVLVPVPTGPPLGICLSTGVALDELTAGVLVDGLETWVAVDEISATVLDSITTTVDSMTLTATVLPDELGGQSFSQTC